jgi:plasmid stabilization system protein ParE
MNVVFLEEASREFSDAFVYYESQQPGLELRFEEEIDRAIRWILEHPHVCGLRRGVYRRLNLRIFPYYIPYVSFVDRISGSWQLHMREGGRSIGSHGSRGSSSGRFRQ